MCFIDFFVLKMFLVPRLLRVHKDRLVSGGCFSSALRTNELEARLSKLKLKSKERLKFLAHDAIKVKQEQCLQYHPGFFHVKYLAEILTFFKVAGFA